jgi:hypothetical protein
VLLRGPEYVRSLLTAGYDVHPDGQRFILTRTESADRVVAVLNAFGARR